MTDVGPLDGGLFHLINRIPVADFMPAEAAVIFSVTEESAAEVAAGAIGGALYDLDDR